MSRVAERCVWRSEQKSRALERPAFLFSEWSSDSVVAAQHVEQIQQVRKQDHDAGKQFDRDHDRIGVRLMDQTTRVKQNKAGHQ